MIWLRSLVGWLRSALGVEERPPQPLEVLVDQEGDCKAYLLFSDKEAPVEGLVEVWLLRHELSATKDCLILLINIVQIRESYGSSWDEIESQLLPDNWRRAFEYRAKAEIRLQAHIAGTHLFMVGWMSKRAIASRFVRGHEEHYRHIECQRVYSVDLIGLRHWLGLNEQARQIIRAIVKRAIATTPGNMNPWENLIFSLGEPTSRTTWLDWLSHYARTGPTKIDAHHTLQPPKASFKVPKEDVD